MHQQDSCLSDLHRLGEVLSESSHLNLAGNMIEVVLDDFNVSDLDEDSESVDSGGTAIDALDPKPIEFASIKNGDTVELSAVQNDLVWVRAVKYDQQYEDLLININKCAKSKTAEVSVGELIKGKAVIVEFSGDFSRGIVHDIIPTEDGSQPSIEVQLLDHGLTMKTDKSERNCILKKITVSF